MTAPLLPLFVKLAGRDVLVVGGGAVALLRVRQLAEAGARVTVVAPEVRSEIAATAAVVRRRPFDPADLDGAWFAVAAATPAVNRAVGAAAEARRVLVNAVDDPDAATAYTAGVVRRGHATVAISTGGRAPALAGLLREAIAAVLPRDLGAWVDAAEAERPAWKRDRVPLATRRPLLLRKLNALYDGAPAGPAFPPALVSLVGAGPGDAGLLTRRGAERLAAADVVLYDALVDSEVLRLAPRAHCFFVGKRAGRPSVSQRAIERLLVRAARRGQRVVRLKCGDPFVFGRGGEEAIALAEAGVPFEVVPGVSSAIAAPALAGIPVTHRGTAAAFAVVSGHREATYGPILDGLAPGTLTLVVLMGVAERGRIAARLVARGWDPATPAAVVLGASSASGSAWRGTLADLGAAPLPTDRDLPGTLVVGAAAGLSLEPGGALGSRRAARREPALPRTPCSLELGTRGEAALILRGPLGDRVGLLRPPLRSLHQDRLKGTAVTPPAAPTSPRAPRASFADTNEIDALVETLGRFERGEIDADQWRAYRVVRGAYAQRQDGVHMLRIKLPQGVADAAQLRVLAEVASRYSRGWGHVTTRQNLQLHFVRPADLEPALRRLAEAGITTSGAGGNAVRNVVTCPLAGVSPDEPFDPTPYAEALTRHFLRHPLASALPRKFKVAFDGCADDHVATAIQDLGFRARVRTDTARVTRGFAVTVAGGTSSLPTSGNVLFEFLPAGDVLALAEAVVRVFHARGDRVNKQRNRLKFLVRELGLAAFRALVEAELAKVRAEGAPALPFDPNAAPEEAAPAAARPPPPSPAAIAARVAAPPRGPGEPPRVVPVLEPTSRALQAFRRTNVSPQRQRGFAVVTVSPGGGDLTAGQLEVLADLALAHGDGSVRLSSRGHVLLRWVPDGEIAALHRGLAAAGLARDGAGSAVDVVACPGANVCRQAVTRTRGVAALVEEHLRARLGGRALGTALPVHVSGCPNGCAQHHLAAIGLQGSARKLGPRAVPQYFVLVGGGLGPQGATFGRLAGKVPARRVADAVERLTTLYLAERAPGEEAGAFFARALDRARAAVAPLETLRLEDARSEDFVEPGASEDFRPDVGEGECAA